MLSLLNGKNQIVINSMIMGSNVLSLHMWLLPTFLVAIRMMVVVASEGFSLEEDRSVTS